MRANRRRYIVASLLLVFSLVALSAHAAEEAGAATDRAKEIFQWINFAIVAGVLIWVFAKKLPPLFRANAERISSAISKSTAAKEEAERQVRDAETKLAKLAEEVSTLKAAAQQESAADTERLRALARTEVQKVGVAAQSEIEAAERAARLHLKALGASLAVEGAESLLAKELTAAAQESLVEAFAKSLDGRPN